MGRRRSRAPATPARRGSRIYYPDRWSPDGRWFLARVGGYEGSSPAILDLDTGAVRTIPDAWDYGRRSEQAWLPDSSGLLVTRWGAGADEASPELRLVDVMDPAASQAVLDVVPISDDHRFYAYGPATAPDGSLRFGLRHPDARLWLANGVYRSSPDGSDLMLLASLPALVEDASGSNTDLLTWAPDGAAFVAQFQDGRSRRTLVGLADGSGVWDASAVLNQADWITWSR